MTSTTAVRYAVQPRTISLPSSWSPAARLRRFARTTGFVLRGTVSATAGYEGVYGPTARRAVTSRFSD